MLPDQFPRACLPNPCNVPFLSTMTTSSWTPDCMPVAICAPATAKLAALRGAATCHAPSFVSNARWTVPWVSTTKTSSSFAPGGWPTASGAPGGAKFAPVIADGPCHVPVVVEYQRRKRRIVRNRRLPDVLGQVRIAGGARLLTRVRVDEVGLALVVSDPLVVAAWVAARGGARELARRVRDDGKRARLVRAADLGERLVADGEVPVGVVAREVRHLPVPVAKRDLREDLVVQVARVGRVRVVHRVPRGGRRAAGRRHIRPRRAVCEPDVVVPVRLLVAVREPKHVDTRRVGSERHRVARRGKAHAGEVTGAR